MITEERRKQAIEEVKIGSKLENWIPIERNKTVLEKLGFYDNQKKREEIINFAFRRMRENFQILFGKDKS